MAIFVEKRYPNAAILERIKAPQGHLKQWFTCVPVQNGRRIGPEVACTGSISYSSFADIKGTASITLHQEFNWLNTELMPIMHLQMSATEAAYIPLGTYIPSTPEYQMDENGEERWTIKAYDRLTILNEDGLTASWHIPAGASYLDAITTLLFSANISDVVIRDQTDATLGVDRDYEIGTRKLTIINDLLTDINYYALFTDLYGQIVIQAYAPPSTTQYDFLYDDKNSSILRRAISDSRDYLNKPNVFVAITNNPDLDVQLTSVITNDNPASPLSTVARNRKIVTNPPYSPEGITTQAALDAYLRRIAFESGEIYQHVTFTTAINPLHGHLNNVFLGHPKIHGVFSETEWSFPLEPGGLMTHTARKAVII